MRNLIAVKPLVYATRRLRAGDSFTAESDSDANVLVILGKAKHAPAEDASEEREQRVDDLTALRAEYVALVGKKPFGGWSADELRDRITAAKAKG